MNTCIDNNIFVGFIKLKPIYRRVNELLAAMIFHATVCLRKIAVDRAEMLAFHRVINNNRLKKEDIMKALYNKTAQHVKEKHILAIQDTTEFNYNSMKDRVKGLGTVGNGTGTDVGFFVHPMIAVNASDSSLIGLSAISITNRLKSKAPNYQYLPIEDKESYRWLDCSLTSKETLETADMITHISDRESDIYDLLYRVPDKKNHVLVRASRNRNVYGSDKTLFEYVGSTEFKGSYKVMVSSKSTKEEKRTKHEAHLDVRFTTVEIEKPSKSPDKKAPDKIEMYALELKENPISVREGEKPVYWLLLTTHKVETLEDAIRIAYWYVQRWHIEQLFRILKSQGLMVERSQVENADAKIKLALLAVEAAIQIMQLTLGRNEENTQPAEHVFSEDEIECLKNVQKTLEGKTEKQKNHFPIGSLRWASWCIGRLGGWKGYKSESPAGPITMKVGMARFKNIYLGWSILKKVRTD